MPIYKQINELEEDDLLALISAGESEGKYIDFKQNLILNSDSAKKEFLADISSFANAVGGHLIFGMSEQNGVAISLPGI